MNSIYLDNAATSFPKAPRVGEEMARYICEVGANINRGAYSQATEAALTVFNTRGKLKKLFSFGGRESHVVFTPGATFGLNAILKGFLRPGDHAVVSSLEHNAVMRPLCSLAERGVSFSRIPAGRDGITNAEDILPLIKENTRLVLVSHASNVCGTLFPLEEVSRICRKKGIPLAVDAAQTAGHVPIDFDALGLSALCVPGHKGLLGPQGVGALLLAEEFAAQLSPIVEGGTGSQSQNETQPEYFPDRLESGTLNLPGIYGLSAALDFLLEKGAETAGRHETALAEMLIGGLKGLPLRVAGTDELSRRVGVFSLDFQAIDNAEAAFLLENEHGILTRCGLHCAPNAHKTVGTFPQGSVRLSVGCFTSEEDVCAAVEAVKRICER